MKEEEAARREEVARRKEVHSEEAAGSQKHWSGVQTDLKSQAKRDFQQPD